MLECSAFLTRIRALTLIGMVHSEDVSFCEYNV